MEDFMDDNPLNYGGVPVERLEEMLSGNKITNIGIEIFKYMGVVIGEDVSMEYSTAKIIIELYNSIIKPFDIGGISDDLKLLLSGASISESTALDYEKDKEYISQNSLGIEIGSQTTLGKNVSIFFGVNIGSNCIIGDKSEITSHCSVGSFSTIGRAVYIGKDSSIDHHCELGDYVTVPPRQSIAPETICEEGILYGETKYGDEPPRPKQ